LLEKKGDSGGREGQSREHKAGCRKDRKGQGGRIEALGRDRVEYSRLIDIHMLDIM
jgi:hypothetical protein